MSRRKYSEPILLSTPVFSCCGVIERMDRMRVNIMTRDMIIDAIVAGAGIWGCMVARRRVVTGCKGLVKWAVGVGE